MSAACHSGTALPSINATTPTSAIPNVVRERRGRAGKSVLVSRGLMHALVGRRRMRQ